MLKNILNLKGAQQLSKKEQNTINGGGGCINNCTIGGHSCPPQMHCVGYFCQTGQYIAYECVPDGDN